MLNPETSQPKILPDPLRFALKGRINDFGHVFFGPPPRRAEQGRVRVSPCGISPRGREANTFILHDKLYPPYLVTEILLLTKYSKCVFYGLCVSYT